MEMRKSEQNAKITSDFHSAEKIINRNLSKFAELKNHGIHSNAEKNKLRNQRKQNELLNGKKHYWQQRIKIIATLVLNQRLLRFCYV